MSSCGSRKNFGFRKIFQARNRTKSTTIFKRNIPYVFPISNFYRIDAEKMTPAVISSNKTAEQLGFIKVLIHFLP